MRRSSSNSRLSRPFLALVFVVLLLPTGALAKILASKAIAESIANGTFEEVRQEMLMDLYQKQKYDFDESGTEALGKKLLDEGDDRTGVEVLMLNQMLHSRSSRANDTLGDAYRDTDELMAARIYYNLALELEPDNAHARTALAEIDSGTSVPDTGNPELDAALAQAGVRMTPEQLEQMQQLMAQSQQFQGTGATPPSSPSSLASASTSRQTAAPSSYQPYENPQEGMFCEGVERGDNTAKKIPEASERVRFEGNYGQPDDAMRTWNVETMCRDYLFAVPLWADVSPPVLERTGPATFKDYAGNTWTFELGSDGKATGVTQTAPDGSVTKMNRLGDPRSFD